MVISNVFIMVVILVMAVHYTVGIVQGDLCAELSRTDGLLALLREQAGLGFEGLNAVAGSAVPNVIDDICSQFSQLCNYPGQTCDPAQGCTANTINQLVNESTINDNGNEIPVPECPTQCTTTALRNQATSILDLRDNFLLLLSIINDIYRLLGGIVSGETLAGFVKDFCSLVGNSLTLIYIGSAFLGCSMIAAVALLIWLSW